MIYSLIFFKFLIFHQVNSFKLSSNPNDNDINLGIVNGYFTNTEQFPFQVSIFQRTDSNGHGELCGGVIMNTEWVITAAHCVMQNGSITNKDLVDVRIGIDKLNGNDVHGKTHKASQIFIHPQYDSSISYEHDVALIKLNEPIQYSDNVKPACFDFSNNQYDFLIAIGYGRVTPSYVDDNGNFNTTDDGDQLKYAFLKETRNICYNNLFICVNSYYSGDSPCFGDSGGPLLTQNYNVIGVFSNLPEIEDEDGKVKYCIGIGQYTRLSTHVDFINRYVGSNYCTSN